MIFVYMLCGYHHGLISRAETTNEDYKKTYRNNQGTPFNRCSYISNFVSVLIRRLSKPLFNAKQIYLVYRERKDEHIAVTVNHDTGAKITKEGPQVVPPPASPPVELLQHNSNSPYDHKYEDARRDLKFV